MTSLLDPHGLHDSGEDGVLLVVEVSKASSFVFSSCSCSSVNPCHLYRFRPFICFEIMARLFLSLALFSCQNGTGSIFLTSALVEVETIPEPLAFPFIPERRLELVRVLD